HDSQAHFPQNRCPEGTQKEILEDVFQWACSSPSKDVPSICWLQGPAGSGKSAIAQAIAERCEKKELLASFFFSRTDPNRNTPKYLALAIADALTTANPSLQHIILQVVNHMPEVLHMTLEGQFRALVIEPLLQWGKDTQELLSMPHTSTVPPLVIIDGLDECLKPVEQKQVLSLALLALEEKLPIHFLICSQPEPQIQEGFNQYHLHQFTKTVSLDNVSNVKPDIRTMLHNGLNKIRNSDRCKHLKFPNPWPSWLDLEILVDRSSDQSIYLATFLRF
ncbi:hypothetical protein L218DRAFT_829531, partial [Marasmius fiardii PR-910]